MAHSSARAAKRSRADEDEPVEVVSTAKAVKKHSLDSDEEEESEQEHQSTNKYDLEEGVDGEEESGLAREGDIKLTPFNMKEEMSEGHFDREGNYFWNKEIHVRDAWLENLDEGQVPEKEAEPDEEEDDGEDDEVLAGSLAPQMTSSERGDIYRQMLQLMKPGENVAKSLRRLGAQRGGGSSASARWRKKPAAAPPAAAGGPQSSAASCLSVGQLIEQLTGCADQLLSAGSMEVYQLTYEAISHQLKGLNGENGAENGHSAAMDMFGDNFDESNTDKCCEDGGASSTVDDTWDYVSDADAEQTGSVQGPYTASQLHRRKLDGKLSEKALVRRKGTDKFYSARRVDFELYMD